MALKKRGKYRYGDGQLDIREELARYAKANGYPTEHFAEAVCSCGGRVFRLALDDEEGVAVRTCIACKAEHPIGDSDEDLEDASPEEAACPCGGEVFELTVGVALYTGSEAVKWLYLGCRCPACKLTAVYGDWKNEHEAYDELLARV